MNPRLLKTIALFILIALFAISNFSKGVLNRDINIQCPALNTEFPNAEALEKINQALVEHSLYAFYNEHPNTEPGDLNIWYMTQYRSEYEVKLHTEKYLSVYFDQYVYHEGAMHGIPYGHGVVFNRNTGDEVTIAEMLQDIPEYKKKILSYVEKNFDWGRLSFEEISKHGFYITKDAVVLLYYETYAGGHTYELAVPYSFLRMEEIKASPANNSAKVSEDGMVLVERGSFLMGDEWGDLHYFSQPVHEVTFTYDYEIGQFEVTNSEFVDFLNDVSVTFSEVKESRFGRIDVVECYMNGHMIFSYSERKPENEAISYDGNTWYVRNEHNGMPVPYGEKPVAFVTWYGAVEYCNWLNRKEGLEPTYIFDSEIGMYRLNNYPENKGYRLPTEAEWENAARGGRFNQGHQYSGSDDIDDVGWYRGNCNRLQPIGLKLPNELGIYDMSGNVDEWCSDNFYSYGVDCQEHETDFYFQSTTKLDFLSRINRGGDWYNSEDSTRVADRAASNPESSTATTGFRLVKSK